MKTDKKKLVSSALPSKSNPVSIFFFEIRVMPPSEGPSPPFNPRDEINVIPPPFSLSLLPPPNLNGSLGKSPVSVGNE